MVCARLHAGEGVDGTFFGRPNTYLFIGDYKYWLMTHWDAVDLEDGQNYVLNRARLYRDRRDFVIETGDTGKREDYPTKPAKSMPPPGALGQPWAETAKSVPIVPKTQ